MTDLRAVATERLRQVAGFAARRVRPRRAPVDHRRWDLELDQAGGVVCHGSPLRDLPGRFGSPLHVVNAPLLREQAASFAESLGDARLCASYGLVSVRAVLAELHDSGADSVVGSVGQLELSRSLDVAPERVVFAEPAPTDGALRTAISAGVRSIVLSSTAMTERCAAVVAELHDAAPRQVSVGWQMELYVSETGEFAFGAQTTGELVAWLRSVESIETLDANLLRVVVRPRLRSSESAADAGRAVAALLNECMQQTDWQPDVLISVDIPAETTREVPQLERRLNQALATDVLAPDVDPAAVPHAVARSLVEPIRTQGCSGELLVEPGASLTSRSGMLLSTVLDVKTDREPCHVILDAGINLATETLSEFHQLINASTRAASGQSSGDAVQSVRVAGPICTPADVLYANWRLPGVEVGDVLAIMDTGSRFVAESTSFSFPQPAVVMCDGDGARLVRDAETFERLVALDFVDGRPVRESRPATS